MQQAHELDHERLAAIVESLQVFLFVEIDAGGAAIWNPDSECCGAELCEYLVNLFAQHDLVPLSLRPFEVLHELRESAAKQPERLPWRQLVLLREVYLAVYAQTESLQEDYRGADLAYLLGAMLENTVCQWNDTRPIVAVLRSRFPASHAVWRYVELTAAD